MKTAIILLVVSGISFFPLLAISGGLPPLIRLPTNTKADVSDVILDTAGNPVVAGELYYAVPSSPIGVQGGISVVDLNSTTGNPGPSTTCPTDVVLNLDPPFARPFAFYPLKREDSRAADTVDVIIPQYPVNVAFSSGGPSDPCAEEIVWRLSPESTIVTGGVIGKEDDLNNWFRIQKNFNGSGYLFNWWPSLCHGCRIRYFHIGTVGEGDQLQLGINYNDESLYAFEFFKANNE